MSEKLTPVLSCRGLSKTFRDGSLKVDVLKEVDFDVMPGEQIAILGTSGAGKSTLLHILGGLDKPTQGIVKILGQAIHTLSEKQRCALRNKALGFIYQFHHLLPEFSVLENVCMPLLIRRIAPAEAKLKAIAILEKIGMQHRLHHKLGELSGGERQRTAIARALVTKPRCVLADEPTGNLDTKTATKVYESMLELNRELQTSIVIVTHDERIAAKMDRVFNIESGLLKPLAEPQTA
ncbi:MAG: lipoprotein-releasing ABC transporter ATP-binding protein LolD [Pseudomonadota bacterium]